MHAKPLYERYRPQTLDDFVGNPAAVNIARRLMHSGLGGRAVFVSGVSGVGKSTLGLILARSLADPLNIAEFVARKVTSSDLRDIERTMHYYGMGAKPGRAYVFNEAHGLSKPVIEALLDLLEHLPAHVVFIFTTTRDGQEQLFDEQIDAGPLLSRCIPIKLSNQGLAPLFAARARQIAQQENLNGQPEVAYLKLVQRCRNNMRAVLQAIEAGEMLDD
jgi:replication-associated recombination protein RarA